MSEKSNSPSGQNNEIVSAIALLDLLKEKNVSPDDRYVQLNRYWQAKARREGIPLHGILELTPFCNLDCKMCYIHLDEIQNPSEPLLPAETWIRLIDEARDMGLLRVSLSGGECLTHPEFEKIYLHLYHRGINVRILTNGVLMDENRIAFFQRYPPDFFQISLYGSDEAEYEAVTGHRVYGKVMENLKMLKNTDLSVAISITPSPYMRQDFRPLIEKAKDLGFPFQVNSALIDPRKNTGRRIKDLSGDQYVNILKINAEIMGQDLLQIDSSCISEPNTHVPEHPRSGTPCGAGRSTFTVQYNGRITPCVGLTEISEDSLAMGFSRAWKSLNKKARDYLSPVECQECVYASQCALCPAVHKHAPPGHCDRRICERTIKLVSIGILRFPEMKNPCG